MTCTDVLVAFDVEVDNFQKLPTFLVNMTDDMPQRAVVEV